MNNNFNNMDDLFNQLMGNMGGFRSESRRYMINGREVTPEEFAIYLDGVALAHFLHLEVDQFDGR